MSGVRGRDGDRGIRFTVFSMLEGFNMDPADIDYVGGRLVLSDSFDVDPPDTIFVSGGVGGKIKDGVCVTWNCFGS